MPELPEVETVVRELRSQLKAPNELVGLKLFRGDLRNRFPKKKLESFVGLKFTEITRRSKYLLFGFENGQGFLSHLGMTGHWRIEREASLGKELLHDHIRLQFKSGDVLIYNDPRRFGYFDVFESPHTHKLLKDIGPEPFGSEFHASYLKTKLKGRTGPIKNLLMNQSIVAGIGNIYASEVLYRVGIKPLRRAGSVTLSECEKLVLEIRKILQESIDFGGSSFDNFKHVSGEIGGFQDRFDVYDREKQKCKRCSGVVLKKVLAGRSTYWCSKCQK